MVKNEYKKICKDSVILQIFVYLFNRNGLCQQVYRSQYLCLKSCTYR